MIFQQMNLKQKISRTAFAVILSFAFSTITTGVQAAIAQTQKQSGPLKITADRQSYNPNLREYNLSGKVHVTFQNMEIVGNQAKIEMDESGKPQLANFYNRPVFKHTVPEKGQNQVIGNTFKLFLTQDKYNASGDVESVVNTVAADPFLIYADTQSFDNNRRIVTANGNVKVDYQDTKAFSNSANLRMSADGNAERVIFTGNAKIEKEASEIFGNRITVMVGSGNLIAEHNVKTNVTLKPEGKSKNTTSSSSPDDQPTRVYISSDYQQYDKQSDIMIASGNVRILYGDYVATGPKASFQLNNNNLDTIILTGRSTINEVGRRITADKIVITTSPKNFDAFGNVKVSFPAKNVQSSTTQNTSTPSQKPATANQSSNSKTNADEASTPEDYDYEY
ncbi:MAG: LptA/OstA family protein [Cyanobacteria bacterium P01_H01_bin.74]